MINFSILNQLYIPEVNRNIHKLLYDLVSFSYICLFILPLFLEYHICIHEKNWSKILFYFNLQYKFWCVGYFVVINKVGKFSSIFQYSEKNMCNIHVTSLLMFFNNSLVKASAIEDFFVEWALLQDTWKFYLLLFEFWLVVFF